MYIMYMFMSGMCWLCKNAQCLMQQRFRSVSNNFYCTLQVDGGVAMGQGQRYLQP